MNFKTTIVLLVALLGVGILVFILQGSSNEPEQPAVLAKLLDLKAADLSRISIANTAGVRTVMEKTAGKWRLVDPVNAPVDTFAFDSLQRAILDLRATSEIPARQAPKTGLDQPQYTIELTANNKTTTLCIGNKLLVSDGVYAQIAGQNIIKIVPPELLKELESPATVVRQKKLVETSSQDIKQVVLTHKDKTISLQKQDNAWKVVEPEPMPADDSAVTSLLAAISGLTAVEFVDQASSAAASFKAPPLTIFYSTQAPATQPSAQPASAPAGVTIRFGSYDDLLKKNVYAQISDSPAIAKVAATVLESFNKTTLDLRDRNVVSVDPSQVSRFSIKTDVAATTQPATMPARSSEIVIDRRPPSAVTPLVSPSTQSATTTAAAATQASPNFNLPATRASAWVRAGASDEEADEVEVNALLTNLHPLKAEKFVAVNPSTQPTASYLIKVTTIGPGGAPVTNYEIAIVDPGGSGPLIAECNHLRFEWPRANLKDLEANFVPKPHAPPPPPPSMGGGPGGPGRFGGGMDGE